MEITNPNPPFPTQSKTTPNTQIQPSLHPHTPPPLPHHRQSAPQPSPTSQLLLTHHHPHSLITPNPLITLAPAHPSANIHSPIPQTSFFHPQSSLIYPTQQPILILSPAPIHSSITHPPTQQPTPTFTHHAPLIHHQPLHPPPTHHQPPHPPIISPSPTHHQPPTHSPIISPPPTHHQQQARSNHY